MAGLLDYLSAPNAGDGVGGLLSYLQSPLYRSPEAAPAPQPQYDAMGNYTGITPDAPNPFGPVPQANMPTPSQFQMPSVFNGGVQTAPVAGLPSLGPQGAAPQPVAPQAPAAPQMSQPLQTASIGGYQMPQFGSAGDYTPQAAPATDFSAQTRQAPPDQQMSLPPALGGIGSALGRAFNPDGLIARLTGNDSRSIAQQNLKAQYEALVPLVGQQKAMLAVLNPEAGKTILAQALEKKNYGFQKLDSDTVLRTDPQKGTAEVVYGGDESNRAGVAGPDGKTIPDPAGLDAAGRKVFANEIARINADAAGGKKTEVQAKSEKFGNSMEQSEKTIKDLEGQGTSLIGKIAGGVPLGNYVQSAEFQKYTQAKNKFITAVLRDQSGAAIGTPEFVRYEKELFPQPGDGPEVIKQKAEARRIEIEGMKKAAGPGYKSPTELGPQPGAVQMGYRFKGGNPADRNSWEKVQ
jgi:hypothetical protein